ncbi:MAG: hypothetical protein APF77_04145 [Clostridia bacterium BRH_c25]|nr:MAG: hypothetical protein APF77_04145 [Clostridia bacterium BRH_c25]
MGYILGIDTGGTYTDAVLLDIETQKVKAKAKALTTYGDLAIGICSAINNLKHSNNKEIKGVSLSTTLATNTIVEGRGCEAGLLLIGHEPMPDMPTQLCRAIGGGHDVKGNPVVELNIDGLYEAIEYFRGKADAIAISGYFSIRNPEHENIAKKIIQKRMQVPIVCAHQLTTSLGFYERSVTAVLNAKLIPIITGLIESVKEVMKELDIDAPLMIVKGDGTLMSEAMTVEKPIDTILSGPAASIVGGTALTGFSEAIVLDMGGTTTDIAILQKGVPLISQEGATVGGWLTRVEAAKIYTYGIGGDSQIYIGRDMSLHIGPQKVWPLAVMAGQYPHLVKELEEQAEYGRIKNSTQFADCFVLTRIPSHNNLGDAEKLVIELLESEPHSLRFILKALKKQRSVINLQRLVNMGILSRISITPTDILHAKGIYNHWNTAAAKHGVSILAERMGMTPEDTIDLVMDRMAGQLSTVVFESLLNHEGVSVSEGESAVKDYFVSRFLKSSDSELFDCNITLKYPIIAIGAPVKAYLPMVADKLNAALVITENAEVANAIGAATGRIVEKIKIILKPLTEGGVILHAPWERKTFPTLEEAKDYAVLAGKEHLSIIIGNAALEDYQIIVDQEDRYIQANYGREERLYLESIIDLTAIGRPKW